MRKGESDWIEKYRKVWKLRLNHLEEFLHEFRQRRDIMLSRNERKLVITRIFDAPPELVWKAWTDPELIQRWWGPNGFDLPTCRNDFRVGGRYLFCMRSPDGQNYWNTGIYREIVPLERIVYTDSFSDADGNFVPASFYGLSSDFPEKTLVTVTFEELDGKTKLVLQQSGIPAGSDSESANQGWSESFDKLANILN
jgi:uncharacterized protein YndB with AHSA1/START domain